MSRPFAALFLLLVAAAVSPLAAQSYPTRPIRVIVPFPPGGVADVVARLVTLRMTDSIGQPFVIENRTGASGTLGVDAATKAEPDGHTILIATGDFITIPTLMPKTSYDPNKDLIPVTMVATAPLALVASMPSGFKTMGDVLAAAKAAPGTVTFSSPGVGTINHLAGEWIGIAGGAKLLHVPYRGGAPAATALATGEVQLGILTLPSAMSYVQAGKARIIAVLSKERPSFVKDQPTIAEGGMPEVQAGLWVGMFVPAGTPAAVVSRLDAEMQKALADPTVKERLNGVGTEAHPLDPKAFVERIRADAARYNRIIEQTGIKPER